MLMQVTLTPDDATVERVARALYARWHSVPSTHDATWDELLADADRETTSGQRYGDALRWWRAAARDALAAAVADS